mmetsp:Transcript_11308/g.37391  ORF Transcript_11308/g.37391 Transcript_11308/m.37391 type:complete len:240 (-) Transcript_11308:135-854(-)
MPSCTNFSGCSRGSSTTSRSFIMTSFDPPTSAYVTSGFSSTVIIVTVGSIFAGRGMWMKYLVRSTPTRMPSSMSVGATCCPKPTTNFAICFTLITYCASSVPGLIIFVHRATCNGCSSCIACLSWVRSHVLGCANPVSLSLMPQRSLTFFEMETKSSSNALMESEYGPRPYVLRSAMSSSSRGMIFLSLSSGSGSSAGLPIVVLRAREPPGHLFLAEQRCAWMTTPTQGNFEMDRSDLP